jgi:hypothetical protein
VTGFIFHIPFDISQLPFADTRDEIVLWDQEKVWIYTQDRPFTGGHLYAPIRNPTHNDSNYRTSISLPSRMN